MGQYTLWMKLQQVTTTPALLEIQLVQTVVVRQPLLLRLQDLVTSYLLLLEIVQVACVLLLRLRVVVLLLLQHRHQRRKGLPSDGTPSTTVYSY